MQAEVVHSPDAKDAHAGVPGADAVHERAARGAEVVRHGVARRDSLGLRVGLEVFAPAQVLEVGVVHHEVGGEHGRRNLAAVGAVAHEDPVEAGALRGLEGFG